MAGKHSSDCRQGRDRPDTGPATPGLDTACAAAAWAVTLIAAVAGAVHLAARMGWV